jgi:hypothetical protein
VLLALILAGAAVARVQAFGGIVREDSFHYVEMSHHVILTGELFPELGSFATTRLTLVLPLILANKLFGYGETPSIAWPFLCSMLTVVLAFLIARKLAGPWAGVIAATVLAAAPVEVELATMLLPDAIVGFFIALAVWLALEGSDLSGRTGVAVLAASGVAIGAAYFARITSLAFLPLVMAIPLIPKQGRATRWWHALVPVGGVAVVLGGAAMLFWALKGDPLYDWHRSLTVYENLDVPGQSTAPAPPPNVRFGDSASYAWILLTWRAFAPLSIAGILAGAWAYIARRKGALLPILWVLGFYVYIEFVSPLHHLAVRDRYLEPVTLPLAILVAMVIVGSRPRTVKVLGAIALAAFAAYSVQTAVADNGLWRMSARYRGPRTIARSLHASDGRPVFVQSDRVIFALNYYTGYTYGLDPLQTGGGKAPRMWLMRAVAGQPWRLEPSRFVLNGTAQPPPPGGTLDAWAPYPDGKRLTLWSSQARVGQARAASAGGTSAGAASAGGGPS